MKASSSTNGLVASGTARGCCALAAALAAACAPTPLREGQPFEGLTLTGRHDTVEFRWTDRSVYGQRLRPGQPVELVASYGTAWGPVHGEIVSRATVAPEGGRLAFGLAGQLRMPAASSVCLRMRVGHQALPLRAAGLTPNATASRGGETAGFEHAEWATRATRETLIAENARRQTALRQEIAALERTSQAHRQRMAGAGTVDLPACARIQATSAGPPRDVLPEPQHRLAAERECVWRYRAMALVSIGGISLSMPEPGNLINFFAAELRSGENTPSRQWEARFIYSMTVKAREMAGVFRRHDPHLAGGHEPLLFLAPGHAPLALPQFALNDLVLFNRGQRNLLVERNVSVGAVEAFDACVDSALQQFGTKLKAWNREQSADLLGQRSRILQARCQVGHAAEAERVEVAGRLRTQLEELLRTHDELARAPQAGGHASADLLRAPCREAVSPH